MAAAAATTGTAGAARALADLERVHQRIEAVAEQAVDLGHHAAELGAVEVALHQVHHVLDQQVALHLHDRGRIRAHEQHHEVVARLLVGVALFLVEIGVVEGDFDGRAAFGQFVQRHAHLVERLAEVLVAGHGPAHLEHVVLGLETDAGSSS
jgi:hypothetical protein